MLPCIVAASVASVAAVSAFVSTRLSANRHSVGLDRAQFKKFKLTDKIKISHDSYVFRFALPKETDTLGLPIGQHIAFRALCDVKKEVVDAATGETSVVVKQEMVQHSYTPITSDDEKGYVDFLVKVYFEGVHPRYPFGGRLSQHLYNMKIGDTMEMMGPMGPFTYHHNGRFTMQTSRSFFNRFSHTTRTVAAFAMVAGGSGITPMLQIMRAIHARGDDKTQVFLVYCNKTEDDILLREELDALVRERPQQFHVFYTLTQQTPAKWAYGTGRINETMLRKHLPMPSDFAGAVQALLCGPPTMLPQCVIPHLFALGYPVESVFAF